MPISARSGAGGLDVGGDVDGIFRTWNAEGHVVVENASIVGRVQRRLCGWFPDRMCSERPAHLASVHGRLVELGFDLSKHSLKRPRFVPVLQQHASHVHARGRWTRNWLVPLFSTDRTRSRSPSEPITEMAEYNLDDRISDSVLLNAGCVVWMRCL